MKTPVQIVFRNLAPSAQLEAEIRERAARLETYYEGILECRVLVELPHRHHRRGNHFQVRIDLKVPGDDLVATRGPNPQRSIADIEADDRGMKVSKAAEVEQVHKDAYLAVREAFEVARRRLQDFARRERGAVKTHAAPASRD
jgi:ribosome-associated translation inhibitor RaiA